VTRIRILSDLHLEFSAWEPPKVPADVVVLAGDIDVGTAGLEWAGRMFADTPVVYVVGNHEYFGHELAGGLTDLRRAAKRLHIHLLENDAVVIGGVRFLGTTLWTDFAFYGGEPPQIARAMAVGRRVMVDYRAIRFDAHTALEPGHTLECHQQAKAWLAAQLGSTAERTVVVTHHLPHPQSVHARYAEDPVNPCFASDLSALVRPPVNLWVHGHTHESIDYAVEGTRVVCNPRGYLPHQPNRQFQPTLVVEV
jgi:predicted phosphodiesterase